MTEPEKPPAGSADHSSLTRGMIIAIWAIGGVIVVGAVIVVSLLLWLAPTTPNGAVPNSSSVTRGPNPGATAAEGSEVQPPAPDATSDHIPPIPSAAPLVQGPLPESGSAEGELVEGFPTDVMGPAPDSQVLSSSIATEGTTMQVTLVARASAAQNAIEAHYRDLWGRLGLTDAGTADGAGTVSSSSPFTSVSLAFTPASGTGTVYMVHGVFQTE